MNSSQWSHSRLLFWLRIIPTAASAIAILVSCLVLVGWIFDIPTLKSVLPNLVTMKANTAIAFLLSGVALGLLHRQHVNQPKRRIAQLCAFTVVTIGGLTLGEYLFHWNLGIDQWVFREMPGAVGTSHLGRMAPNTALNFILIGSALLLLSRKTLRCYWLIQVLSITAALIAWQPLLGYAYKFEPLYGIASFTHMALHTVLAFIVLCFGILFARPGRGVMRVITSITTGGFVARRLLVAAIALPSLLGYIILQGERAQLYNSSFGLSLLVMASIVVFSTWIWQNAETLARSDTTRKQAEAAITRLNQDLQRRVSELETLFEVIPISIAIADDPECQHIRVNPTFAQLLEIPSDANASCTPPNGTSPLPFKVFRQGRELPGDQQPLQYAATHSTEVRDFELDILQNNGELINLFGHAAPLFDEQGKPRGAVGAFLDITERKHIQEALNNTNQTLQALIRACPLAITVFSLDDGQVKMWNPAAEKIFGWSEHEVLGSFLPSVPDNKRDEFLHNLQLIREGKTLTGVETRRQKKGGLPIDINLWAAPLRDAKGNVSCMSIVADISERKQAEAALRESEERFRKLTEKVRFIPWEADPNTGKFTYVGPQTVEILGYPLEDWYTDNFWPEHIHPDDRDWALAYCQDNSAILDNYEFEYRMLADDGRIVWLYDIVNVVRSNGYPSLLRGFMIDITERKQAEQEREQFLVREQIARAEAEQARTTAESANRMKDEFLATLSHELRTPLNAMLGWIHMLRTRTLDESTAARALETIDRNTKSLATLIEDVLDVSRIIRGELHLTMSAIELVPIIDAAIDTIRPAAQAKDIQIKSMLNPDVGLVFADANRLQQVVWNLLSNAVKFTPKGGCVEVELSVVSGQSSMGNHDRQQITDNYIRIQVSDTGKGISPEFLPYVFDRFRQEDSSTTRTYGGLGLGLAIVRHLVELHGGTVHADSLGEGRGATFSVYLPLL